MKIPDIFKNSAIYTIITILQKGISFFLLPLYTSFLSPDDYGIIGVVGSISSFLSIFLTLGIGGAMSKFYYENSDISYRKSLYGTIAIVIIVNCCFWGILFGVFHKYLVDPFIGTIPFYPYILIGLINSIITPLYLFFQNYLQTSQQAGKYAINSMCFFFINVGLIVFSLCILKLGVIGVLLSNLTTALIFLIYVAIAFLPKLILKLDIHILKKWAKYTLPLLPHSLANWSNGMLDRLLINGIRSQSDAGLYNLGQQYGSVISSVATGINQAYVPWFFKKVNDGKDGLGTIKTLGEASSWTIAFCGLFLAIFSKEIIGLMVHNPAYSTVWLIVPCIIFAYVFQSLYYFYVNVLFLKDTNKVFLITVVTVGINIGLNLCLIPLWGFVGSAIACVVTYFVKSVVALLFSVRLNRDIRFNWISMYLSAFIGFGLSLTSLFLINLNTIQSVAIKILICLAFALFIQVRYKSFIKSFIMSLKIK